MEQVGCFASNGQHKVTALVQISVISGMLGSGSVRLIQVGNNTNDHFKYFLGAASRPLNRGVRLIKVSFKVNKETDLGTWATVCVIDSVRLIRCLLNAGFTVCIREIVLL